MIGRRTLFLVIGTWLLVVSFSPCRGQEIINPYPRPLLAQKPAKWHPLEIADVKVVENSIEATVRNHGDSSLTFTSAGGSFSIAGKSSTIVKLPRKTGIKPFAVEEIILTAPDLPPVKRPTMIYDPAAKVDWISIAQGPITLQVAPDGSGARLLRQEKIAAVIAPLVWKDGRLPEVKVARKGPAVQLTGTGIENLELRLTGDEIIYSLKASSPVEGPVVRVLGTMEQGLLAGVEYLGKGERSSSTLDIEGPQHVRHAPNPLHLTMPLMAFVAEQATVAMLWSDTGLQPTFATPNFFDGTADHRMSLRGSQFEAVIRLTPGWADGKRLEDAVLWAVQRKGLPKLPVPPRTPQEQEKLCLAALEGGLRNADGWGHCIEPNWKRQFYAEHASTIFRLTGKMPELPRLTRGGAHIRNDAAFLLSGRAQQWRDTLRSQAEHEMKMQKPDGSYHYDGQFRRGHFEDTASGLCARPAHVMLEYAWFTGDKAALAAGLKTLDYMKRFRTPRGAQIWECPLHSPDILASAYLVMAYVRGYELTGKQEYLDLAVRWALSGVPFVYQWSNRPIMPYATIAVLCATHWRAPVWIGLPVQWCGTVYAQGLLQLAPHDKTLDWKKLAEGILISGEQQQYPDGPSRGCLPDSFALANQHRNPPDINPCALVSLRLLLSGELDSVAVATDGKHRIAAPFPVTIRAGQAHLRARAGLKYQVLIDGRKIVDVDSRGEDVIALD